MSVQKISDWVDLLATICNDYPRLAERSDEYLRNREIQLDTVASEK